MEFHCSAANPMDIRSFKSVPSSRAKVVRSLHPCGYYVSRLIDKCLCMRSSVCRELQGLSSYIASAHSHASTEYIKNKTELIEVRTSNSYP